MYRELDLQNTHLGLIMLYTAFNLSLAVWLMKGFIDEIPRAYEEAALVDGYSRLGRSFERSSAASADRHGGDRGILPDLRLERVRLRDDAQPDQRSAKTVPVYFAGLQGNIEGVPWPQMAAGALIFVVPIVVFTVLVRKHLLRGVTFGTIKQ